MPRISGIEIPETKRIDIALTHIYGIGRQNVGLLLAAAKVEPAKKTKDLNEEEISRLQRAIDRSLKVEGDLRKEVSENIKRLKQTGSYRGKRHLAGLPVRGQRTRTNARTKRGKRMTIGALKKEALAKKQQAEAAKAKTKQ
ncbi:MAG TPA: 30S ribosomal protein S13 [Clostridia bacterium]|nr:30S ribosomal protein S13 [Clostridia bacterium]